MNRLVAFGCSHTYGESLPDCLSGQPMPPPSRFAWPYLLAQRLSLECVNHAECGASNKEIHNKIVNTPIQKNDTVCILWTHTDRTCFLTKDYPLQFMPSYAKKRKHHVKKRWQLNNMYYGFLHTEENAQFETQLSIDHTYRYFKDLNITNYHFTFDRKEKPISSVLQKKPSWFSASLHNLELLPDYGKDGEHPGLQAHHNLTTQIYEIIK